MGSEPEKIKLCCAECGAKVRTAPKMAGKMFRCPKCGETARFEPVQPPTQPEAPQPLSDSSACPSCQAVVEADDVICTRCGHNLKLGFNVKTIDRAQVAERFGIALGVGTLAAFLAGALWAGIVVITKTQIGWVAIGVGFIAGIGIAMTTTERGPRITAAAGGTAVAGILIGKILMVSWAIGPLIVPTVMDDPDFVAASILYDVIDGDEDALEQLDEKKFEERVLALRKDREALKQVVTRYVEYRVSQMSYLERIKGSSSFYDLLWMLLAIGAAAKVVRED